MKKIILIGITLIIANLGFSQLDDNVNNVKNFRFGLKGDLNLGWLKPENEKKFKSNGVGFGYGWGAQIEYRLNKTASIVSGFSIQTTKGKISYSTGSAEDSVVYILDKDESFVSVDSLGTIGQSLLPGNSNKAYFLQSRKFKFNYVNIPVILKMKTKEIGYFTYYGQFGLNLGIRTKAKVSDESISVSDGAKGSPENLNFDNQAYPIRTGLIVGGGAEYTISGTTAVFFDLTYNYTFNSTVKKNTSYLRKIDDGALLEKYNQKFLPGNVALTVGILF